MGVVTRDGRTGCGIEAHSYRPPGWIDFDHASDTTHGVGSKPTGTCVSRLCKCDLVILVGMAAWAQATTATCVAPSMDLYIFVHRMNMKGGPRGAGPACGLGHGVHSVLRNSAGCAFRESWHLMPGRSEYAPTSWRCGAGLEVVEATRFGDGQMVTTSRWRAGFPAGIERCDPDFGALPFEHESAGA